MDQAEQVLRFANEYIEWKRKRDMTYSANTPEEFLEEIILKEKAEAFDEIWDMFNEGTADLQQIEYVVLRVNDPAV